MFAEALPRFKEFPTAVALERAGFGCRYIFGFFFNAHLPHLEFLCHPAEFFRRTTINENRLVAFATENRNLYAKRTGEAKY